MAGHAGSIASLESYSHVCHRKEDFMKRNILAALSLAVVVLAGSVLSAAACPGGGSCAGKSASAAAAGMQQATYTVSKVECKDCVTKITSALQKVDGVSNSAWDSKAKAMNVAFVPGKADTKAIAAAINGAGFPAKLVTVGEYKGGELCTPEMCKAMGNACSAHGSMCTGKAMKSSGKKAKASGSSSM